MRELEIFATVLESFFIPLLLFVLSLGLLAYIDLHYASQLIQMVPVEEWPTLIGSLYQLVH